MNIIKQLIDSDGNNIYPIAYAQGGSKFIKLWENPSTEAKGAFNVTVDNSYDLYFVNARSTDSGIEHLIPFMLNGKNVMMAYITASGHRYTRTFTANTSGLLEFNVGQYDGSTNNISMLPRMVFGLKCSWIVPTTVQELQYIEV